MPVFKYEAETKSGKAITLTVSYYYQPLEKATLEYPGCDAEIEYISAIDPIGNQWYGTGMGLDTQIYDACWDNQNQEYMEKIDFMLDQRKDRMMEEGL